MNLENLVGRTRIPNPLIRRSTSRVHSRPHSPKRKAFDSMGVHSRPHKSTENGSQLGSHDNSWSCVVFTTNASVAYLFAEAPGESREERHRHGLADQVDVSSSHDQVVRSRTAYPKISAVHATVWPADDCDTPANVSCESVRRTLWLQPMRWLQQEAP